MKITDEMVERAAYALERHNKSAYEWSDELFDVWWSRDPRFNEKINAWSNFTGTEKEKLFCEVRLVLDAALK
jgi:hypothetical protein